MFVCVLLGLFFAVCVIDVVRFIPGRHVCVVRFISRYVYVCCQVYYDVGACVVLSVYSG